MRNPPPGVLVSAPGRTRTCDTTLRRRVLYPLSYRSVTIHDHGRIRTCNLLGRNQVPYPLSYAALCLGRESNPHSPGSRPGSSASWDTQAYTGVCRERDSNPHCPGSEAGASYQLGYPGVIFRRSAPRGSNPPRPPCQGGITSR